MSSQLKIFTDGGSRHNPGPAASAFVVFDSADNLVHQEGHYLGEATNNQAEYQAVLFALSWLQQQEVQSVSFFLDSQLVVNQINGSFKIKDLLIKQKASQVFSLLKSLSQASITFSYVPRAQNYRADALVNQVLDQQASA